MLSQVGRAGREAPPRRLLFRDPDKKSAAGPSGPAAPLLFLYAGQYTPGRGGCQHPGRPFFGGRAGQTEGPDRYRDPGGGAKKFIQWADRPKKRVDNWLFHRLYLHQ
ncbi:hypothetical protein HMPREF0262_00145 [Clostridium sp. ATCC 29733]|nr:hypothetical protein HMPREF0262_00145 [Clostridium sp. ATCC 29733]